MKNQTTNYLHFWGKQILCTALICLTFSCSYGERIKGNGIISKENRAELKNFDKIKISAAITAEVIQGDKESVVVEADQNLLEYLITEVTNNNTLHIHWKKGINLRKVKKSTVYITLKSLKNIHASSASSIKGMNKIEVENLNIHASSAAEIELMLIAKEVTIQATSAADIELKGTCKEISINATSAADIDTKKLHAQNAIIKASSAASVDVYATEFINAKASSCGDIDYYGDPKDVSVKTSSCGDIDKK